MTVTSARKKDFGHSGSYAGLLNQTETQLWRVTTDDPTDTLDDIIASGVLPGYLSQHPDNPLKTVRGINLNQSLSPKEYEIEIQYSSEPLSEEEKEREAEPDPTKRAAQIEWTSNEFLKPIYEDINGEPTLNSAGDYPDPPIEVETSRWVISIEKHFESIPSWVLTHRNVVNQSAFTISGLTIPAGAGKTSGIRIGTLQNEGEYQYYTVSIQIQLATELETDWTIRMLDQGLQELDYGPDLLGEVLGKKVIKIDGEDAKQPVLLDGTGVAISNPTPSDAVYLDYKGYPEADFSVLPGIE